MSAYKIALVEAASRSTHVYSRTTLPRVGIATMGAVLKNLGYHCDIWIKPMSEQEEKRLAKYDIVGIGSLSNTIAEAYRLADFLRQHHTTVVMGGPHVTFLPEEALNHCDFAVIGEGDATLPALISAIENGRSTESVNGIAYKQSDGKIGYTKPAEPVDYASLPSPDFLLSPQVSPETIPPIIVTSRGCPHDCSFCSVTSVFGRKYRFKTAEQVISEIRPIQHRSICFGDDNFCANPVRTKSLLREMIRQKAIPLRWSGQMCVKAASDRELLSLMQQTRCRIVYVGIESVDPDTLKRYGKVHKIDAIKECVDNLHAHGIGIHGMFVVDRNDKPEAAQNIVDYAIHADIDTIQIFSLTPFPGTRSFTENRQNILHQQWDKYDGMHVVVRPENCSAYTLQKSIADQLKRFYSLKRVITSFRHQRAWRFKYRLGGHILVGRWLRENRQYMENLKLDSWPEGTKIQSPQMAPPLSGPGIPASVESEV